MLRIGFIRGFLNSRGDHDERHHVNLHLLHAQPTQNPIPLFSLLLPQWSTRSVITWVTLQGEFLLFVPAGPRLSDRKRFFLANKMEDRIAGEI
jgi:hypothetical protein